MATSRKRKRDYLKRLPAEYNRGQAYVHWSMTIDGRKRGWLTADFHSDLTVILIHTAFRFGVCCPIYCCMPHHIHLLWIGICEWTDQREAVKYFRKHVNLLLANTHVQLQKQPHDHVLRDDERERSAFETIAEYIARNPERAGLVSPDSFQDYDYTGCVIPGYPELNLWSEDYWPRFWRVYSHLRKNGLSSGASVNS